MWTLRDLWFLLNPDSEDEWRQNKAKRMSLGEPLSLRDVFQRQNSILNETKALRPQTETDEALYLKDMYSPPYKRPYKGML